MAVDESWGEEPEAVVGQQAEGPRAAEASLEPLWGSSEGAEAGAGRA